MTSHEFTALQTEISEAIEEIEEETEGPPFKFLEDFFSNFDSFLIEVLCGYDDICDDENLRPESQTEDLKANIYEELDRVRRYRKIVKSNDVPSGLYFLLEDIKRDLDIDLDIGIEPGTKFSIYKLSYQFKLLESIAFWADLDSGVDAHLIRLPRSEYRHPINYSLLVHECFHTKTDLVSDIRNFLHEHCNGVPQDETEEISNDLLALNYIGPAYGLALAKIPEKIGYQESVYHPSHQSRFEYILNYLDYIEDLSVDVEDEERAGDILQKKLISDKDYHPIYRQIQNEVRNYVNGLREPGKEDFNFDDFHDVQEYIEEKLANAGIPTYVEERGNTREYLGMPEASVSILSDKLDVYLLDNPENEVAIPVKPILLFNLLTVVKNYEQKNLTDTSLESFKKWYVTRRTDEELQGTELNNDI